MMIDDFLRTGLASLLPKFESNFIPWNTRYKHILWKIVAEKPTISNIAHHRVCLPCASQIFFHEKIGNYLKIVWRRRHWRRSRFRKENRKFRNSNIAKLGAPPKWRVYGTLEISVMTRYLDDHEQCRPKKLVVDAHLYRLLSPQK